MHSLELHVEQSCFFEVLFQCAHVLCARLWRLNPRALTAKDALLWRLNPRALTAKEARGAPGLAKEPRTLPWTLPGERGPCRWLDAERTDAKEDRPTEGACS